MLDLILDVSVVAGICNGDLTEFRIALDKGKSSGIRNWISVGQRKEILDCLVVFAKKNNASDPQKAAKERLRGLLKTCMWLSALSEEGDTLDDFDPTAAALTRAANRLGKNTLIITTDINRLKRGRPFADVTSLLHANIQESIQFVDLAAQQDRIRPELERNLHKILRHGHYVMGPEVTQLEHELANYVGVEHCISVSSGTDALLVALMAIGVGVGDEVVTSPFTFFATAEAITLLGARPVFVDINPDTFNIDPDGIQTAITARTRVILPVSLFGQCADMDAINDVAELYGIAVIEDGAQSFGASYKGKRSCGLSTIGCTSFFPAKPLGAYGEAGACLTNDASLAKVIREIINHGQEGRYRHIRLGINGRMDSLQAGVLLAKLSIFDDELVRRRQVANRYETLLLEIADQGKLKLPTIEKHNTSSWGQYTVKVQRREKVQSRMSEDGIPTAVHYPLPLYAQPVFDQEKAGFSNTSSVAEQVLSLPMHPYLKALTQDRIAKSLIEAIDY